MKWIYPDANLWEIIVPKPTEFFIYYLASYYWTVTAIDDTCNFKFFYHNEMQRGYGGLGSYSVSPDYCFAAIPLDE